MAKSKINTSELLLGAAIGGLIAAGSISLLKSKNTTSEGTDLKNKFHDYKDKIEDFIYEIEDNVETQVSEKAKEWFKTAKEASEYLKDELETFVNEDHGELKVGLITGGLLGAVLGMEATKLYYAKEIQQDDLSITSFVSQNAGNWKGIVNGILDIAADRTRRKEPKPRQTNNRVHDAVDFVDAGIQLWKSVQKK